MILHDRAFRLFSAAWLYCRRRCRFCCRAVSTQMSCCQAVGKEYRSHIQYLLGGTPVWLWYCPGECKCSNGVRRLETLGHALTGRVNCCYLAICMRPTLRMWNTYSMAVACCVAYTVLPPVTCIPYYFWGNDCWNDIAPQTMKVKSWSKHLKHMLLNFDLCMLCMICMFGLCSDMSLQLPYNPNWLLLLEAVAGLTITSNNQIAHVS